MRTTIELPPELLRAAKARSAEHGESLKAFLTRAVAAELGGPEGPRPRANARVQLPLFGRGPGRIKLSNADLEAALSDADAEMVRPSRPGSRRSRGRS